MHSWVGEGRGKAQAWRQLYEEYGLVSKNAWVSVYSSTAKALATSQAWLRSGDVGSSCPHVLAWETKGSSELGVVDTPERPESARWRREGHVFEGSLGLFWMVKRQGSVKRRVALAGQA